jgi:Tetraspanin family
MTSLKFPVAGRESSGDDGEFSRIDLASGNAESADESLASTIYDPSVLTLDPKVRAQLERDEAEKERKRTLGNLDDEENGCSIVMSPHSPQPGKDPFAVDEEIERALIDESPLCCCGLFPLRACVFGVNGFDVLLGFIAMVFGIVQLSTRAKSSTEGFGTLDTMLLSGPEYVNIAAVVGGAMLLTSGIIGIALANDITFGTIEGSRKAGFMVYQAFLLLVAIVFLLLSILNIVALAHLKGNEIYDESHWRGNVQTEPQTVCETELKGKCSGFNDNKDCLLAFSTVLQTQQNCPGHFCYDFCQVRDKVQNNPNPICSACRTGYDWHGCKEHEENVQEEKGCARLINSRISSGYDRSISVVITLFLAPIVTLAVAGFRACCLAPRTG